jgi:hypothetical protein
MDPEEYNKAKQALASINTNTRLDEEQRLKYQLNLLDAVAQRYRTVQKMWNRRGAVVTLGSTPVSFRVVVSVRQ